MVKDTINSVPTREAYNKNNKIKQSVSKTEALAESVYNKNNKIKQSVSKTEALAERVYIMRKILSHCRIQENRSRGKDSHRIFSHPFFRGRPRFYPVPLSWRK